MGPQERIYKVKAQCRWISHHDLSEHDVVLDEPWNETQLVLAEDIEQALEMFSEFVHKSYNKQLERMGVDDVNVSITNISSVEATGATEVITN